MSTAKTTRTTLPSGKRWYDWRGERYWSVTTIIGQGIPKPALLPWGIKMVAEGAVSRRSTLAAMLSDCKTPDECTEGAWCEACDQTIKWLKGVPYAKRDKAANLGTLLHAAIEAHRLGQPFPPIPADVQGHMAAFEQFLVDFQPEYLATEAPVFNRSQHYAGTLDGLVRLTLPLHDEPGLYVLDAKSGKGVYPEVGLQLSAYSHAEFIGLPDGDEQPMPATDGALALHLTADGYRLIEVRADDEVFTSFLYAREVFRFLEETSKTILGVEYGNVTDGRAA